MASRQRVKSGSLAGAIVCVSVVCPEPNAKNAGRGLFVVFRPCDKLLSRLCERENGPHLSLQSRTRERVTCGDSQPNRPRPERSARRLMGSVSRCDCEFAANHRARWARSLLGIPRVHNAPGLRDVDVPIFRCLIGFLDGAKQLRRSGEHGVLL